MFLLRKCWDKILSCAVDKRCYKGLSYMLYHTKRNRTAIKKIVIIIKV